MRHLFVAAVIGITALSACKPEAPKADAPVDDAPRVLSPKEQAVELRAKLATTSAMDAASTEALRQVEKNGTEMSRTVPDSLVAGATAKFTLLFGANNHGERNDCGCKKNPMGGLGRRHTMLNGLTAADDTIWTEQGPAVGPVFHVDAGDLLFAHNTLDKQDPASQKTAKYDAESVAAAMQTFPPDALLVGEHDLVFGADYVEKLAKKHDLKFISANVQRDGKLVFPASLVAEHDGVKVAFVGLTKDKSRRPEFYTDRKLQVLEPVAAAKAAIAALPPADAVVLLSNLGIADTKTTIDALRKDGVRVDLAIVSSTNRMTSDPEFAHGVPVMEPMSRGKYIGRADVWITDGAKQTEYLNAGTATPARLRDYRRAVRSYWSTRKQLLHEELKIAEAEMTLESLSGSQQPDAGAATEELKKRRKSAIQAQKDRLPTIKSRLTTTSQALLQQVSNTSTPDGTPSGDDWFSGYVVPVKIDIVGEKSTRKVLDPREAKRPQ